MRHNINSFEDVVEFTTNGSTDQMESRAEWAVGKIYDDSDTEGQRWDRKLKLAIAQEQEISYWNVKL